MTTRSVHHWNNAWSRRCDEAWGAWHGTRLTEVPDYVKFFGPLIPPE